MARPPGPDDDRPTAVVLAGGTSRRFGRDKLEAEVDGLTLLDATLSALPSELEVLVVGPSRRTRREVRFVREEPAGGGPGAALVAGLRQALRGPATLLAVLPADAPAAGEAAALLLEQLAGDPGAVALVGVDDDGREQPLQLALRRSAAQRLVDLAPDRGAGASARRLLLTALGTDLRRVPLPPRSLFDIDTPAQLAAWTTQGTAAVTALVELVEHRRPAVGRPVVLALDGPGGSGKSTLAEALRLRTGATVLPGDDFYAPAFADADPAILSRLSDAELADQVFDWPRLRREALEPLAAGRPARYRPYDWSGASTDGLGPGVVRPPAPLVVLEGVYASRPELADLVTASVLVTVDEATRARRLAGRADDPVRAELWARGERWYFGRLRTAADVDLVVEGLAG